LLWLGYDDDDNDDDDDYSWKTMDEEDHSGTATGVASLGVFRISHIVSTSSPPYYMETK
jgi:hypothetical protein